MNKQELIQQTENAFEFNQKLYFEVSYLIKEVEGLLAEEDEKFEFGRSSGYHISTRSSTGLEPNYVNLWPLRKMAVFFVPEELTQLRQGQTITKFENNPKVIYLRILLDDKELSEPVIYTGVLHNFVGKRFKKVEQVMAQIEYHDTKVFTGAKIIAYEDAYIKFNGQIDQKRLYDINTSEEIYEQILKPALKKYRAT
jgi:hypothetical protein